MIEHVKINLVFVRWQKKATKYAKSVKARRNTYGSYSSRGSYKKSLPCGVPQELFCMAKMMYFKGTGMIFPRLALL
jgi:hypothetical protein